MQTEAASTRTLDTRAYVSVLKELTDEGKKVSIPVVGNSMAPFLAHGRDVVCFEKPKQELRKGDVVFYQRKNGQYVLHRICRVTPEGYYIVGDAQCELEGPVEKKQIFGVVISIRRKGKWIGPEDFWWKFFQYVWIRIIPFRRPIARTYRGIVRLYRRIAGLT